MNLLLSPLPARRRSTKTVRKYKGKIRRARLMRKFRKTVSLLMPEPALFCSFRRMPVIKKPLNTKNVFAPSGQAERKIVTGPNGAWCIITSKMAMALMLSSCLIRFILKRLGGREYIRQEPSGSLAINAGANNQE